MLRWEYVADKEIFGLTVKMYRDPFEPYDTSVSAFSKLEFDHYAYKHLGSELFSYKILDTNFEQYMEERGDLERMVDINIPLSENDKVTVY